MIRPPARAAAFLTALCFDEHEPYFPADGPYYSSCDYFRSSRLGEIRGFWRKTARLIRAGRAPRDLGLYIHWPFCAGRCAFCFCSMALARGAGEMEDYAAMLRREMDAFRGVLKDVEFTSVYFGGGTPTLASNRMLDGLFRHIRECFSVAAGAEIYVEASPATLTAAKMDVLRRHGVNRVTLGVQSTDAGVLAKSHRRQSREAFERACDLIAREPGVYSGVELMLGLEGQDLRSFLRDLDRVMRKGPDGVYLYGFDPRPQTPFTRAGKRLGGAECESRERLMPHLSRIARLYGYRQPTARPDSEDYLHTISAQCRSARRWGASILGLGASSLSHAFGAAWYRHLPIETGGRNWGRLPAFYCMESNRGEEMRGYVVRHVYAQGAVSRAGFKSLFGGDIMEVPALARILRAAQSSGKVRIGAERIAVTDPDRDGRLMFSKSFYSPRLISKIMSRHRREFRAFNRKYSDRDVAAGRPVSHRRVAAMMTTFERIRGGEKAAKYPTA